MLMAKIVYASFFSLNVCVETDGQDSHRHFACNLRFVLYCYMIANMSSVRDIVAQIKKVVT